MEQRITDELTGSEFLKAASNVDYAALMGVLDNHMSCIKAVCPKEYDAVMSQTHALRWPLPVKQCQTPVTHLKGPV